MADYHGERLRTEQILEVECPKCHAKPGRFCDRKNERLSKAGQRLRAEGTPPSHYARMCLRQGHSLDELPELERRAAGKVGEYQAKGKNVQARFLWPG